MSLQELKEQAYKLSKSDRLALIGALVPSLQNTVEIEDWQYLVTRTHPCGDNSTLKDVNFLPQPSGKI
jgi:hypothetical protein